MAVYPDFIEKGAKIHLAASARHVSSELVLQTRELLENQRFEVDLASNLDQSERQFAGSDFERKNALQNALNDDSISCIFFMRGGYGGHRIVDSIDFSKFVESPKWLVGFSDVTVFHSHVNSNFDIATLHSSMPSTYKGGSEASFSSIFNVLTGQTTPIDFDSHPMDVSGRCRGKLVGGNLSILQSLIGTTSIYDPKGSILFIEDVDEMLYHLDRMMIHLKRAGLLNGLNGIVVGGMSQMRDNTIEYGFSIDNSFGRTAEEIIKEHVGDLGIPLGFGLPCGHVSHNLPIILGAEVELMVTEEGNRLSYM